MRVRESALNDFAAALQPLTLSQNFAFTLWVPNPFLFPPVVPIPFACNASARVTGIVFDITPASVTIRGDVTGAICNITYQSTLFSSVAVSVDSGARTLLFTPGPLRVTPSVNLLGFRINSPFAVNLAPTLSARSTLTEATLAIETPAGPGSLALGARNLQLSRFDGYLEIKGDAELR